MNRRQADRVVGLIVAVVLLVGFVSSVQQLVSDDPMMGNGGSVPAIHFVAPLLVSLLVAAVVAASYSIIRTAALQPNESESLESGAAETTAEDGHNSTPSEISSDSDSRTAVTRGERRVLDLLPEDEQRVLEPVIESPGITQTAIADRAAYSRSKVSQTVTDLEERGLLYRERHGRTYRVYPAEDLDDRR